MNNTSLYVLFIIVFTGITILIYYMVRIRRELSRIKQLLSRAKFRTDEERIKKIRKRYIVFAVLSEKKFEKRDVEKCLRMTFKQYFGEILLIKADPQLIYFDPSIQRGVIRVAHKYRDQVLASLSMIREINGVKCLIIPLKTTGTIKKARKIMYSFERL